MLLRIGGVALQSSKIRQDLFSLIEKQALLENALAQSRDKMTQGSLHQRYTACRKGQCKCTQGQKHGPFPYVSISVKGKTIQRYVGKKEDEGLVKKLKVYSEFRRQRIELNHLNHRMDLLWNYLEESLIEGKIR